MATPTEPRPLADLEEDELARVDRYAHDVFGRDARQWKGWQKVRYLEAIATAHAAFHPEQKGAA